MNNLVPKLYYTLSVFSCEKDTITTKIVKKTLVKCVTMCAEESIRSAAIANIDEVHVQKLN